MTIRSFLNDLGSAAPTPGGGSASAIIGAIGAGLVEMTANVSANRKTAGDARPALLAVADEAASLRRTISGLADEDIHVYGAVAAAYRLPRSNEVEQATRRESIQTALVLATEVPLRIAERCLAVVELAVRAIETGASSIVGDAGVGAHAGRAALHGVLLNVDQNLGSIDDEAYVASRREQSSRLKARADMALQLAEVRLRERGLDA